MTVPGAVRATSGDAVRATSGDAVRANHRSAAARADGRIGGLLRLLGHALVT